MDYIKEYPDLRWTHPTTVLCCGSSFSGKSTWVQNLARDLKYVMKNPPDRIRLPQKLAYCQITPLQLLDLYITTQRF